MWKGFWIHMRKITDMKYFMLAFSIALIGSGNVGCKSTDKTTVASSESNTINQNFVTAEPQLLASIQRTGCYGQCPMYKATFMDNGEVNYVGKRFVEKVGTYAGLISEDQLSEIKSKLVEFDYFNLDSLYPTPIADFPSCITKARSNGVSKKVIDRRNPPKNLKAFEKYLDSVLETVELTKVSDETIYDQKLK